MQWRDGLSGREVQQVLLLPDQDVSHHQLQQRCLLESWHIRSQDAILTGGGHLPPVHN